MSEESVVHWDLPQRDSEQDAAPAPAELKPQGQPALGKTKDFQQSCQQQKHWCPQEKERCPVLCPTSASSGPRGADGRALKEGGSQPQLTLRQELPDFSSEWGRSVHWQRQLFGLLKNLEMGWLPGTAGQQAVKASLSNKHRPGHIWSPAEMYRDVLGQFSRQ